MTSEVGLVEVSEQVNRSFLLAPPSLRTASDRPGWRFCRSKFARRQRAARAVSRVARLRAMVAAVDGARSLRIEAAERVGLTKIYDTPFRDLKNAVSPVPGPE